MNVDVLFVDFACSKPYTHESLENDSIGGTESSTIRLAEGFNSKGLSVCIIQHCDFTPSQSPNGVIYAPIGWLNQVKAKNVIHLRNRSNLGKFPESKNFIWFHDAAGVTHNNVSDWAEPMIKNNVMGVCVSDWHKQNLLRFAPTMPLTRIYSPVDELCYEYPRYDKVDVNQLVWMSSPHKGLKEALEVFRHIRSFRHEMKLVVFNPGYYEEDIGMIPGVVLAPMVRRKALRSVLAQSLCLFYPTKFEETFGLVAAEANALGTPVACYDVAALVESSKQTFKSRDDLMRSVFEWRDNRPLVVGQSRFRFANVWKDWFEVLDL
jgi:glycosyltransferase involved in cell wall biosynthesis